MLDWTGRGFAELPETPPASTRELWLDLRWNKLWSIPPEIGRLEAAGCVILR